MDLLGADLQMSSLPRTRAGMRHLLSSKLITNLAQDNRLIEIARGTLGAGAVPFHATLFEKTAAANWLVAWHQDTALPLAEKGEQAGWGPWSVKQGIHYAHAPASALGKVLALRVHLDESSKHNGPLRVLPGTHELGVLSDRSIDELCAHIRARDCLVPKGGVLAIRPLLIHASSKSQSAIPRRVLHIEYAVSMEIAEGMKLARA